MREIRRAISGLIALLVALLMIAGALPIVALAENVEPTVTAEPSASPSVEPAPGAEPSPEAIGDIVPDENYETEEAPVLSQEAQSFVDAVSTLDKESVIEAATAYGEAIKAIMADPGNVELTAEADRTGEAFDEAMKCVNAALALYGAVPETETENELVAAAHGELASLIDEANRLTGNEPVLLPAAYPAMTGDDAYLTDLSITSISDGTGPFDANNEPGNDQSSGNKIVRTFDTVNYIYKADMALRPGKGPFGEARVKVEAVLPLTSEEAEFDLTSMGWMANPVITTQQRSCDFNGDGVISEDEKNITCQVLTGEKVRTSENDTVVPGEFSEPVSIKVKAMQNGDIVRPVISAAFVQNTWEGDCPNATGEMEHAEERKTVTAEPVTVSAAPKYNILLLAGSDYKETFNFNSGNTTGDVLAANYGIGSVVGRLTRVGVTVQLYNGDASRGLKGIELPSGPITFDIKVSSSYKPNDGTAKDVTDDYTPLLWSYEGNQRHGNWTTQDDGRYMKGGKQGNSAYDFAPYNIPTQAGVNGALPAGQTNHYSCTDGGTWMASQTESTISVTVKDYVVDINHFPTGTHSTTPLMTFGANVGSFSAGEFWIVQPFNKLNSENTSGNYDIVDEYGDGTFTTVIEDFNMHAESIGGTEFDDGGEGKREAQTKTTDDKSSVTNYLTKAGELDNRVYYTAPDNTELKELGTDGEYATFTNGRDSVQPGENLILVGGFNYNENSEAGNKPAYSTSLMKFDASAIELTGTEHKGAGSPKVLYAVKKDGGGNWTSDDELKNADEDDLVFYASLEDIPDGKTCVAAMLVYSGTLGTGQYKVGLEAKVKETAEPDKVCMFTEISRVWSAEHLATAGVAASALPSWTAAETALSDFPSAHYSSWFKNYTKESYDENGAKGTHSGSYQQGDSLLIVGYKTYITKNTEQQVKNELGEWITKDNYNLDNDQRIVDFVLKPRCATDSAVAGEVKTTVTVTDTLPKYLTYKAGSAYFGGTYVQTSENGGTQGRIDDGVLTEPNSIVNNADGTQTLTWIIPNVTVNSTMPAIHYSATIGTKGNEATDVPALSTTGMVNEAHISGTGDHREQSVAGGNKAEKGITVTRGAASSFAKIALTPVTDANGMAGYRILYSNPNNTPATDVVLMDTMPYDGDSRGSHFSGGYTMQDWRLNKDRVTVGGLRLYYTINEAYKEKTTAAASGGVTKAEIEAGWTEVPILSDGTAPGFDGITPVAWALVGTIGAQQTVEVDMYMKLKPTEPKANDRYTNSVSQGQSITTVDVSTVSRTLEGLTWMDSNRNGIQDSGEEKLSGVKVMLFKLKDGGDPARSEDYELFNTTINGTSTPMSVKTGKAMDVITGSITDCAPGQYKFTNLPAGTYAVEFTQGDVRNFSLLTATLADQGTGITADSLDSDGAPFYNAATGKLFVTRILDIVLPEAEDMSVALYESKFHDSGFYEAISYEFTKIQGADTAKPLSGAEFTVYKANHTHTDGCRGLLPGGTCTFIASQTADTTLSDTVWDLTNPVCTAASGSDGKVKLTGLAYGVYMLVETKAPEGYELSRGCWLLDVRPSNASPVTITASAASVTALPGQPNAFIKQTNGGIDSYFLPNYEKIVLPVMGGAGTIFFTVGGIVLIGAAILLLILAHRKKRR